MNRIKKALRRWMGANELTYSEFLCREIGVPIFEPPINKKEEEKMKWKCFNCDQIVAVENKWPDGSRCPFCGGGPIYAIQTIAEVEEPSALKLINRVSENGSLVSEHLSIEPPMELTIQWDAKVYGMVSLKPGELLLKRRVEEAEES
ncbi:hypothetical protein ACHAL6_00670 [Proteiniclasticum sp. C24MP]|uniref:hypothetical protein n=1 Tax=Proteiniclasticum sp. C24MP TaxID=3374101 RepID=UPI003754CF55